jgi:predicted MPP superfamily phosphohydrolase
MTKNIFSRKDFLKLTGNIFFAGLATSIAGLEYSSIESEWIEIKTIDLQRQRLPKEFDDYRFILINDTHFDGLITPKRISKTIDLINKLESDTK